ncbi:lysosomal acid lipase/cholesteryl ester hydrolase-like [Lacerta agilis]|uniref:lysosomal acid lipase/cholesteryl ester hydrolase-like n=1 Tax=Lacerta agilis TaxID=80427 RepID=UPI00141A50A8|nr:lysosomal acid lipase/cholesteryl ester hydrolase-like [Lacerta agilis]
MNRNRSKMWLFWGVACLVQQALTSEEFIRGKHLNPQEFMKIPEIIQYWGYPSEEYTILTEDGYYLQANRIPHGINCSGKTGPRSVALLVVDIILEGRNWIANLPSNSLGFVLADAGYDVWILNNRGTTWSRRHKHFSIFQKEFWNFSFHETAIYDIPAAINFILQKTKQKSLYYIGHSQGSSVGLIAFSIMPQLAKKVKLFLCFAPGYVLVDTKGPFSFLLRFPDVLLRLIFGNKEFCLLSQELKAINAKICSNPVIDRLCLEALFILLGRNEKNLNVSRADVYTGIFPDYTSVKTFVHWGQVAKSNQFKYFDYGPKNAAIYNMSSPPFYKVEDSIVPTAVWSAGHDIISSTRNVELLLPRITNLVFHRHIPDWQHVDYIWGLDAPERLYKDVLCLMQKYK